MLLQKLHTCKDKWLHKYWEKEFQTVDRLLREAILSGRKVDPRFAKEIEYMRECNEIMFIPYRFREHYPISGINVKYDQRQKMKYVLHEGKRLYFPTMNEQSIKTQYQALVIEQDEHSPHRYFSKGYEFEDGMIFVDVGAAEGILSLEVVEKAKEIYLLECDKAWIRALEATFHPWKDKVHIIPKYAGRKCNRNSVALDALFLERDKNERFFIKIDVEGMEPEVLEGAQGLLRRNKTVCVCATYHTEDAAKTLKCFFRHLGYMSEFSKNYILFRYGFGCFQNGKYKRIRSPYFRKGLIRAKNEQ